MYAELYQYLLLHHKLSVPGIGTFLLNRKPAENDFPNRQIKPPSFSITFEEFTDSPGMGFYKWLGNALGITDRDAVIRFNDFVFETKRQISNGDIINWSGVGSLTKGLGVEVKFSPATIISAEQPVTAEKVIREKAEHMVRVGEDEKTSVEMSEMLNRPVKNRSYWWVLPLIIGLLAAAFIGWYVAEHGFDVSAIGNRSKLCPSEALP
jgi:hypothetical protein